MSVDRLLTYYLDAGTVSTDTRKIKPGDIFFALKGANFNGNAYAEKALETGASYVVIDEESYHQPEDKRYILVENALLALQRLARAYREHFDIPFVGITGSNGKTTTKELIHAVLSTEKKAYATKGNFNNHIGVPLTLLGMPRDTEIAIVEMGANQPGDIAELSDIARPTHAVITNIGQAHLEKFLSIEGVRKTKGELFDFIRNHGGLVFLNEADENVKIAAKGMRNVVSFGAPTSDFHVKITESQLESMEVRISHKDWKEPQIFPSKLSGTYNAMNILIAITIGSFFGISIPAMREGIANYVPTNNRSQILKRDTYTIWLDAYNANPSSMRASIENLFRTGNGQKVALVIGDMFELGATSQEAHTALGKWIDTFEPFMTVGVGKDMGYTLKVMQSPHKHFENVASAKEEIAGLIKDTDLVLLKGSRGIALERLLEVI